MKKKLITSAAIVAVSSLAAWLLNCFVPSNKQQLHSGIKINHNTDSFSRAKATLWSHNGG